MSDIPKRKKGQVGLVLTVETTIDLSTASSILFRVRHPDGGTVSWSAVAMASPDNTKAQYTTVSGDLDNLGVHRLFVEATIGSNTRKGETTLFEIVDDYDI